MLDFAFSRIPFPCSLSSFPFFCFGHEGCHFEGQWDFPFVRNLALRRPLERSAGSTRSPLAHTPLRST